METFELAKELVENVCYLQPIDDAACEKRIAAVTEMLEKAKDVWCQEDRVHEKCKRSVVQEIISCSGCGMMFTSYDDYRAHKDDPVNSKKGFRLVEWE